MWERSLDDLLLGSYRTAKDAEPAGATPLLFKMPDGLTSNRTETPGLGGGGVKIEN